MAELALEQNPDLGDYLAILRRRFGLITLISGMVFATGLVTAFVWPSIYQSSSTILIEAQEVPAELIQSTVTSFAAQRIQVISQRVMTRSNLLEIMDKYDLYRDERKRDNIEEVITAMREDISINMITADVVDPRTGRPAAATIAFTLGFKSKSPGQAQKVANEITTLFLNENLKSRTENAAETYDFLTVEANRLKDEIARYETQLAEFKERNINVLPESRGLNTQSLERSERELANIDTQIQAVKERKIYLGGQLPLLDPYSSGDVFSPGVRLDGLRTEYIALASRYSPDHPDVARIKKEIRALETETGQGASADELYAQLDALKKELVTAENTYTQEHPDVKNIKRQIAVIETELQTPPSTTGPAHAPSSPDNPAYVNLQTQLAAADSELNSLTSRRMQLLDKIAEYEARLMQIPKIEQEYRTISRDLNHASQRYQDIRAKQMTAEVGQEMEKERKGEKFTLIDPAVLPQEPISPNRPAIILLSLMLALGAGVGSAAIAESVNSAVRGVRGVAAIVHMAPLAVIPYLPNAAEARARLKRLRLIVVSVIAIIIMLLLLVHFLYSPLDVLWFRWLRKVDTVVGD